VLEVDSSIVRGKWLEKKKKKVKFYPSLSHTPPLGDAHMRSIDTHKKRESSNIGLTFIRPVLTALECRIRLLLCP